MASAQLDGSTIVDDASFHAQSRAAFGFPDSYGATMDAWIDCMSYLRDDDNMSRFRLGPDEVLKVTLLHAADLQKRLPDLFADLLDCIALVNDRCADYGEKPAIELIAA